MDRILGEGTWVLPYRPNGTLLLADYLTLLVQEARKRGQAYSLFCWRGEKFWLIAEEAVKFELAENKENAFSMKDVFTLLNTLRDAAKQIELPAA